ncbi:DUF4864 domain-containing protein [Noviherbaspirillum massiliense]|uniref:DUF4864 domain-containing protein n=1 Tax=Noviherbaspirillum massiliense TaxID=1465823 RepID=UPI0009DA905D|nr:DUF4864 domain-containing protein [Noviherbaspirillum massiliense]
MKSWLAMVGLLLSLGMPPNGAVAAESLTAADAQAIQAVVQTQLEAFMDDDATTAFQLATASTRMQIGTPDNFLRLIKEQYTPMYRHETAIFSKPEVVDGDAIQLVRLTDGASHVWLAIFWMQQDEDNTWKVDGCQLLETTSISI